MKKFQLEEVRAKISCKGFVAKLQEPDAPGSVSGPLFYFYIKIFPSKI